MKSPVCHYSHDVQIVMLMHQDLLMTMTVDDADDYAGNDGAAAAR